MIEAIMNIGTELEAVKAEIKKQQDKLNLRCAMYARISETDAPDIIKRNEERMIKETAERIEELRKKQEEIELMIKLLKYVFCY